MSKNKTYEILTVYLRKRKVYIHLSWTCEFSGLEVLAGKDGSQVLHQYLLVDLKECG